MRQALAGDAGQSLVGAHAVRITHLGAVAHAKIELGSDTPCPDALIGLLRRQPIAVPMAP